MHFTKTILATLAVLLAAGSAFADSSSSTGTLASSTDTASLVFVVGGSSSENVTIQTLGFGGGVNAAGQTIVAGGFDPFVGVFSGTGSTAAIVTDGMGDPFGTSDALSNFGGAVPVSAAVDPATSRSAAVHPVALRAKTASKSASASAAGAEAHAHSTGGN